MHRWMIRSTYFNHSRDDSFFFISLHNSNICSCSSTCPTMDLLLTNGISYLVGCSKSVQTGSARQLLEIATRNGILVTCRNCVYVYKTQAASFVVLLDYRNMVQVMYRLSVLEHFSRFQAPVELSKWFPLRCVSLKYWMNFDVCTSRDSM